jgi:hypothetical protein
VATPDNLDTHRKALSINLDPAIFGSFAEIGAGQEVARWFLQVGAASGTVAKAISAYDKEVSDDLYGAGSRYVSKQRLQAMLEQEWKQLLAQLEESRGNTTRFFSFVDTVAARNYAGTNLCHGWIGVRFHALPGASPNDVILHVNLMDPTNLQQQEAIGVLGVNLLYASFHQLESAEAFLKGVSQDVAPGRLEIDYIELRGPAFGDPASGEWDRRALHLRLVTEGLAEAVIFSREDQFVPASEALYKKAVVLAPGTFDQVEPFYAQLMSGAVQELQKEAGEAGKTVLGLFCISTAPIAADQPTSSTADILQRVAALQELGDDVLLIRPRELYRMSAFVNRFTNLPIRFAIGISTIVRLFQDSYHGLIGSKLEGISRLFSQNVRVYAYPMSKAALEDLLKSVDAEGWEWKDVDGWVSADHLRPAAPLGHLYQYLVASNFIVPVVPKSYSVDA